MILGKPPRKTEHSGHGAWMAAKAGLVSEAFAIAGHHSGMPDGDGGTGSLGERVKRVCNDAESIRSQAIGDCPELSNLAKAATKPPKLSTGLDLRIRMLFSCLVDADRTDTASIAGDIEKSTFPPLDANRLLEGLLQAARGKASEVPEGAVKKSRRQVLESCLAATENLTPSLFSLTVPTGGAKTIASMAFALKRASLSEGGVKRIIVVIPFLSIIE